MTILVTFLVVLSSAQTPLRREVRIGAPGVPSVLDPGAALEGTIPLISRQVFDTLVIWREGSTEIEPGLATRWTASRDGLVWSFTLREGVKFHDGTPLTGAEVAASFERQLQPEAQGTAGRAWPALLRGSPGVVKEFRAPSPRTVQIILSQPYSPLLTVLAHPGLAIARLSTAADSAGRLVGTGPYRVVDASGGRIAIEAIAGHWAGHPRSERLVFLEVSTDDQAEAELDSRSLDMWFPTMPPRRTEGTLSTPGLRIGYLAFQTEKEPFSRRPLRQAVATALDPAVLGVALERAAVPLQSFLPPGVWARREGSPILGGSRAAARSLARENWPKESKPSLLVPTQTVPLNLPKLAETIQLLLGSDSMPLNVQPEPEPAVRTLLQAGAYDMALAEATVAGGDPHLLLFPLSTSEGATKGPRALNFSFYRNPRLDDVLIRGSQLSNRTERQRLYQRAQALLAGDLPWLPIYVRLHWAVARAEVRGLRLHPTGVHRLDTVAIDPAR